jgi:hypothetical protein
MAYGSARGYYGGLLESVMLVSRRGLGLGAAALAMVGAGAARADDIDWANVFISPCGQPFRAKMAAPYPVGDWFKQVDKDNDGKITRTEFVADFEAFFKVLDRNGDGVIDSYEVAIYEHNIAPEILGFNVTVSDLRGAKTHDGARLWLAQMATPDGGEEQPNEATRAPDAPPMGAAPYTLIDTPEPIAAADTDFSGIIRKANFLALGDRRFTQLDPDGSGFLTLAKLPKTYVQKKLDRQKRGGFHL